MKRALQVASVAGAAFVLLMVSMIAEGWLRAPSVMARYEAGSLTADSLTPEQLEILIRVEDPRFFTHHGIDLSTPGAGATSITQGLVKFLFFQRFRPGVAKIRQTFLAIGFDARISKRDQLALFLNRAYLGTHEGRPVHGFAAASHAYFGKDVRELTRREWISLVAMVVGPNDYHVVTRPAQNADRVARIEKLLRGQCRPAGLMDVVYRDCG